MYRTIYKAGTNNKKPRMYISFNVLFKIKLVFYNRTYSNCDYRIFKHAQTHFLYNTKCLTCCPSHFPSFDLYNTLAIPVSRG